MFFPLNDGLGPLLFGGDPLLISPGPLLSDGSYYAPASGTGNATMKVFLASNEIQVNVTFAGLSSPTGSPILFKPFSIESFTLFVASSSNVDVVYLTGGVPLNIISGSYFNTTSVKTGVIQDLVSTDGGAKLFFFTESGFIYGDFSSCNAAATTSPSPSPSAPSIAPTTAALSSAPITTAPSIDIAYRKYRSL